MGRLKHSSRKKSYNPHKAAMRTEANVLESCCIINVNNTEGLCKLIDMKGNELEVTERRHLALTKVEYKWSIYMVVLGIDGPDNYTKADIVISDKLYYQHELIDFLNYRHQKLLKNFNVKHLCGFAWLASPTCHDFSEEEAYDLILQHGAFSERFYNARIDSPKEGYKRHSVEPTLELPHVLEA